jgi:hypothetical protein
MSCLTRETIRHTAWAALISVVFVVLLPMMVNASRAAGPADAVGFSAICTLGGAKIVLPDSTSGTDAPVVAHQQPCAFCSSVVPLFADNHAPRVVAVIDGMPVVVPRYAAERIPADSAATQPLGPRAPPRI